MRDISSELQEAQARDIREPTTEIILRDVYLRWDRDFCSTAKGAKDEYFPYHTNSNGVPCCFVDRAIYGDYLVRLWMNDTVRTTGAIDEKIAIHKTALASIDTCSAWSDSAVSARSIGSSEMPLAPHRPSVTDGAIFWCADGDIRKGDGTNLTGSSVFAGSVYNSSSLPVGGSGKYDGEYPVTDDRVALAAVDSNTVYLAILRVRGEECDDPVEPTSLDYFRACNNPPFKYVELFRYEDTDASGSYDHVSVCHHTIIVDPDYDGASLSWFDAETLNNQDVIVINSRACGSPVVVRYKDGVWVQPQPMLPLDIVDPNSFLRVSSLSNIDDAGEEQVLWAHARIGRSGTTGKHAQQADIALRSKDGEHWSIGRYSYLGKRNLRSKLIPYGDYVYRPSGYIVERAKRSWLMNGDRDDLEIDITQDILNWSFTHNKLWSPQQCNTTVAAHDGTYNPDSEDGDALGRWLNQDGNMSLFPGLWLWRYLGYSDHNAMLSVEGIDDAPGSYQSGDRKISIKGRSIATRLMSDWALDQDWQWLSQTKHYDDCDKVDHLYSLTAANIEVNDDDDDSILVNIDEDELVEGAVSGTLEFDTYGKPGIFFTTKPMKADNFSIKGLFEFHHERNWADGASIKEEYRGDNAMGYCNNLHEIEELSPVGTVQYEENEDLGWYFRHSARDFYGNYTDKPQNRYSTSKLYSFSDTLELQDTHYLDTLNALTHLTVAEDYLFGWVDSDATLYMFDISDPDNITLKDSWFELDWAEYGSNEGVQDIKYDSDNRYLWIVVGRGYDSTVGCDEQHNSVFVYSFPLDWSIGTRLDVYLPEDPDGKPAAINITASDRIALLFNKTVNENRQSWIWQYEWSVVPDDSHPCIPKNQIDLEVYESDGDPHKELWTTKDKPGYGVDVTSTADNFYILCEDGVVCIENTSWEAFHELRTWNAAGHGYNEDDAGGHIWNPSYYINDTSTIRVCREDAISGDVIAVFSGNDIHTAAMNSAQSSIENTGSCGLTSAVGDTSGGVIYASEFKKLTIIDVDTGASTSVSDTEIVRNMSPVSVAVDGDDNIFVSSGGSSISPGMALWPPPGLFRHRGTSHVIQCWNDDSSTLSWAWLGGKRTLQESSYSHEGTNYYDPYDTGSVVAKCNGIQTNYNTTSQWRDWLLGSMAIVPEASELTITYPGDVCTEEYNWGNVEKLYKLEDNEIFVRTTPFCGGWCDPDHSDKTKQDYTFWSEGVCNNHYWNGSDPAYLSAGKVPGSYWIGKGGGVCISPEFETENAFDQDDETITLFYDPKSLTDAGQRQARLGYGFGVVGCAMDGYNLVAAFVDAAHTPNELLLCIRRGTKDVNAWVLWEWVELDETLVQGERYEVEMWRDGNKFSARVCHFDSETKDRTVIGEIPNNSDDNWVEWPLEEPIIPFSPCEFTDKGKIGVITNVYVPETKVNHVEADTEFGTRQYGGDRWSGLGEESYAGTPDHGLESDPVKAHPWSEDFARNTGWALMDSWDWFEKTSAWVDDEKLTIDERTPSNWRSYYYFLTDRSNPSEWNSNNAFVEMQTVASTEPGGEDWDDGDWFMQVMDGPGLHANFGIATWTIDEGEEEESTSDDDDRFTLYTSGTGSAWFASEERYSRLQTGENEPLTYLMGLPGFHFPAWSRQDGHAHAEGAWLRQHWNDKAIIHKVWAYDDYHDKTLDWVLKDIAVKAGVFEFDDVWTINDWYDLSYMGTPVSTVDWLKKYPENRNYIQQKNFDITISKPDTFSCQDVFSDSSGLGLLVRANNIIEGFNPWDAGSSDLEDFDGIIFILYHNLNGSGSDSWTLALAQTRQGKDTWQTVDIHEYTWLGDSNDKEIRIVGYDRFFTMYVNGNQLATMWAGPRYDDDTGWVPQGIDNPGYIGLVTYNYDPVLGLGHVASVRQRELHEWTNNVIMDSRMSALSGMKRAIRDRRIGVLDRVDQDAGYPKLKISLFRPENRDDLGTITDHVPTDTEVSGLWSDDWARAALLQNAATNTDRVPTHIRVSGYEISEYIDHDAASRFGLTFVSQNAPSLEEEQAYLEAKYQVKDALSVAKRRRLTLATQPSWELEDELKLLYYPFDGAPETDDYFIVNGVRIRFSPGNLNMVSTLREKV